MLLGFGPDSKPFYQCHLDGICLSTIAITSSLIYLKYVASTVKEYTDSLFVTAVAICAAVCYVNVIFRKSQLFDYFNQFEENINSSKLVSHTLL